MCPLRHISDEQRRRLPEFARPKGSQKMDDFFVTPPQCTLQVQFRRHALKSSHFLTSKFDSNLYPAPLKKNLEKKRLRICPILILDLN